MADLDHRFVSPPYLRLTDRRKTSSGEANVWHLRVAQPNVTHIQSQIMHSVEHFLGDYLTAASDEVVSVAPMGCQTGFYIVTSIGLFDELSALLVKVLETVASATAVPHADTVQCGWAANHSLQGAKNLASWLLDHKSEWGDPGNNSRELQSGVDRKNVMI